MDISNHNYDEGSLTDMSGSKHNAEEFGTESIYEDDNNAPRVSTDNNTAAMTDEEDDELTAQTLAAVSTERTHLYKENTTRLQSILESIKNSTKTVLSEMSVYLGEMEGVEKDYIRCRAKTQREGQRLESVAPDVAGATQNFLNQNAAISQMLGAGGFDVAAMMAGAGAGGANWSWRRNDSIDSFFYHALFV